MFYPRESDVINWKVYVESYQAKSWGGVALSFLISLALFVFIIYISQRRLEEPTFDLSMAFRFIALSQVFFNLSVAICNSFFLFFHFVVFLFFKLSILQFVHFAICPYFNLSIFQFVHISICPFFNLSNCSLSILQLVHFSICPYFNLSIF